MRIALISYHYPPSRAVGGLRAAKDAEALRAAGHEVHVVTARVPDAMLPWQLTPDRITIERVQSWPSPRQLFLRWRARRARRHTSLASRPAPSADRQPGLAVPAWKRWISSLIWLPDDLQGFIVPAYQAARRSFGPYRPDLVMTSAPPFSAHLTGLMLALSGVRWIAEFRDPWTDNPWKTEIYRSRLSDTVERRLEAWTLALSERVVVVSEAMASTFRNRLRGAGAERVLLVRNGIDALSPARPERDPGQPRRIIHVGSCYGARDPRPFFLGLAEVIRDHRLRPSQLQVTMAGACREYAGYSMEELVAREGLAGFVAFVDWVPHEAVRPLMEQADVLLLLAQRQPDQVPNKLYEYLGARRTILAFADAEGESAQMLGAVGGHVVVSAWDTRSAAAGLEAALGLRAGAPNPAGDPALLETWMTHAQMHRLTALLHT